MTRDEFNSEMRKFYYSEDGGLMDTLDFIFEHYIQPLDEALKFYSDANNYVGGFSCDCGMPPIRKDDGQKAREAREKLWGKK